MLPFEARPEAAEDASRSTSGSYGGRCERQRFGDVIALSAPLIEIAATQREITARAGKSPFELSPEDPLKLRYSALAETATSHLNTLLGYLLDNFEGPFTSDQFLKYASAPNSRYAADAGALRKLPEGLVAIVVVHEILRKNKLFVQTTQVPYFMDFARKYISLLGLLQSPRKS